MINQIFISNNNISFLGKSPNNFRQLMDKIVTPLIDKPTPVPEIIKETNYTRKQLDCWSICKYGMRMGKLYRTKLNEKLKNELLEFRKNNVPLTEIVKKYEHNICWVKGRYKDLGLDTFQNRNQALMSKNVPWMLDAGYSLVKMKEQLNISIGAIKNWIVKNTGYTPSEYRKTHNIKRKNKKSI